MQIQHAAPLGLTFFGHRRILFRIPGARGCQSHPLALPLQPFEMRVDGSCVASAGAAPLLGPAAAERRNSNSATALVRSAHGAPRAPSPVRTRFACTLAQRVCEGDDGLDVGAGLGMVEGTAEGGLVGTGDGAATGI